jgi:hydroxylamine dehydrogenase
MPYLTRFAFAGLIVLLTAGLAPGADAPTSLATQECIECHAIYHPGIVADWRRSRHAVITPREAMAVTGTALKVSSRQVPEALLNTSVGCAECHMVRGDAHADTFEHNGYDIHVVVSPDDCATCHAQEREQYADNIMARAHTNLAENAVYNDLERTILGRSTRKEGRIHFNTPDPQTKAEGCYYCHGTKLKLTGTEWRDTDAGEMEFPVIEGWPNQGVGRVNLDGSYGSCTSCHTRHQFSIEMARKPYTCMECHAGPDVPAYKIYAASKHGNLFSAKAGQWRFDTVPWTVGRDFTAPTCAACHISLLVDEEGAVINQRTHQMSDRLGWRLFGLIYAHPQPRSPDTTIIRNAAGLPLPTDLDGTPAKAFLIDPDEVASRRQTMQQTCLACHSTGWVTQHFERLDNTIAETNHQVRTATDLMGAIWEKGHARGLAHGGSLFDEYIERRWMDTWLFYANSTRFASAMAGGGDYGVFEIGRYQLTRSILEMQDWLDTREMIAAPRKP